MARNARACQPTPREPISLQYLSPPPLPRSWPTRHVHGPTAGSSKTPDPSQSWICFSAYTPPHSTRPVSVASRSRLLHIRERHRTHHRSGAAVVVESIRLFHSTPRVLCSAAALERRWCSKVRAEKLDSQKCPPPPLIINR